MTFLCGDRLRYGDFSPGAAGCLVRFPSFPERLLMLTAGHVVLPTWAQRLDAIQDAASGQLLGRLLSWTTIDGDPTADVALIWVDPAMVSPDFRGSLEAPTEINHHPQRGEALFIAPQPGQDMPRQASIRDVDADVRLLVAGPGWQTTPTLVYQSQILSDRMFSAGGDSGSIALDGQGRVVGMVVAGGADIGSVITPIGPILSNAAWGPHQLELVGKQLPGGLIAPPAPTFTPPQPLAPLSGLDLSWLTTPQAKVAREVAQRLAAGGLGIVQQAAALGNALAESSLNPMARNLTAKEDSVGLFQMNRKNGAGKGFSVEQLQQVDVQCDIVLKEVTRIDTFMKATQVEEAVDVFVRKFERPAEPDKAVSHRTPLAKRFLSP